MAYDDDVEFDLLRRRAAEVGLHIQRHRDWNSLVDSGGPYYVQPKRKFSGEQPPSLCKYATMEKCWKILNKYVTETL